MRSLGRAPRSTSRSRIAGRHRCALELGHHLEQPVEAAGERADSLPGRQEARERLRRHRLDLAPQPRQRPASKRAHHVGVGVLAVGGTGPERALEERAHSATSGASASATAVGDGPSAQAGAAAVNGAWVRAQRWSRPASGASLGASKVSGTPRGGLAPSASR